MKDNGILKYYRDKKIARDGILELSRARILDVDNSLRADEVKVAKDKTGKVFYVKQGTFEKEIESEVLLSQVYDKAGVKSAIYTPVVFGNKGEEKIGVVSDSVEDGRDVVSAIDFYLYIMKRNKDLIFNAKKSESEKSALVERFFTQYAVKNCALMLALDLGSYNVDRSLDNYFVKIDDEDRVKSAVSIDNGISFEAMKNYGLFDAYLRRAELPKDNEPIFWGSYFGSEPELKTRDALVEEIKTNEILNEYVSTHELAEQVGSVDVSKVAKDIKQTIGFDVGEDIVSAYDRSFYTLAEELEQ